MDMQSIVDLLSTKIPVVGITIGNVITALIVIIVGYFVTIIVSKYVRKVMIKAKLAQGGPNPDNPKINISSRSSYVEIGGKRLGIIKMSVSDTRAVYVVGVAGTEFHRISCLRKSPHEILVMSGICGAKIKDVFGVRLQP